MALTLLAKTVAVAGTRDRLSASSVPVAQAFIQAKSGNTGKIYIGDNTVASTVCAELGIPQSGMLLPALRVAPSRATSVNLTDIYIDSQVSGEGVNVWYEPA